MDIPFALKEINTVNPLTDEGESRNTCFVLDHMPRRIQ